MGYFDHKQDACRYLCHMSEDKKHVLEDRNEPFVFETSYCAVHCPAIQHKACLICGTACLLSTEASVYIKDFLEKRLEIILENLPDSKFVTTAEMTYILKRHETTVCRTFRNKIYNTTRNGKLMWLKESLIAYRVNRDGLIPFDKISG